MSTPRYDWWPYAKGMIRRYPTGRCTAKERKAVEAAIQETRLLPDGAERLKVVDLVLWRRTHLVAGAAMMVPCSERTAVRWHGDFIRLVGKKFGLWEEDTRPQADKGECM